MRQIFVNWVPPATSVLSGIVISATKEALLVQSAGLVGKGVPRVGVIVARVAEVCVAEASAEGVVAVSVATGDSAMATVTVAACVSVAGTASTVSVGAPPLQADRTSVISVLTMKSFLFIRSLLCILVRFTL
jgi:hypothetical protein